MIIGAIYLRVSTPGQAEGGTGTDAEMDEHYQLKECQEIAARDEIDEEFRAVLPRYLGVAEQPDWIDHPNALKNLVCIRELRPVDRAVAHRIVAARCGAPPWIECRLDC